MKNPFRYFKTSPEIIRLAVMLYVHFPLSLRNVEDLLHERGIEVSHETIRSGGTASVQCLRLRSGNGAYASAEAIPNGAGTWTRCS